MINDPLEKICGNDQCEDIDDIAADYNDFMAEQWERSREGQIAYEEWQEEQDQKAVREAQAEYDEEFIRTLLS